MIKARRQHKDLTQVELAKLCGVGERFINELEAGKKTCQLEKALYVLNMLGCSIEATPRG